MQQSYAVVTVLRPATAANPVVGGPLIFTPPVPERSYTLHCILSSLASFDDTLLSFEGEGCPSLTSLPPWHTTHHTAACASVSSLDESESDCPRVRGLNAVIK